MKIKDTKIEGDYNGFTPIELTCEMGMLVGTYQHKENRLCISHVMCQGCMKELIEYAIKKFNTNHILFYNVMGKQLIEKVKGFKFKVIFDTHFQEHVFCLEGKWNVL